MVNQTKQNKGKTNQRYNKVNRPKEKPTIHTKGKTNKTNQR